MEQWDKNYYISAIAGANNGSSLVVMSKGIKPFFSPLYLLKLSRVHHLDVHHFSVLKCRYPVPSAVL